jgi:hypothetical protein
MGECQILSSSFRCDRAATIAAAIGMTAAFGLLDPFAARATAAEALQLEAKIALPDVAGRIDHMAIDLVHRRLFVAELGNGTVGILDLDQRKIVHRIVGLSEPQGVAYVPATDTLYVANGGDGMVRLFRGADYAPAGTIPLRDDADNARYDETANLLYVGYGRGALAIIDAVKAQKVADIALPGHPESFRLARGMARIYVNVPGAHAIAVVDAGARKQSATWPTHGLGGNFAMALDEPDRAVIAVFRNPARLFAYAMADGAVISSVETCGDVDDVFVDAKRRRIYASCGEGFVDVIDTTAKPWRSVARVRTVAGARTSLFVPELDRLFVAARASTGHPAAIWVFAPAQP